MTKAKNSGLTLIELLIVIVIMGIVAGFVCLSVSNVGSSAARKAATDLDHLLSRCRSAGLSRAGLSYINIMPTADGGFEAVYVESDLEAERLALGGKRVTCTYNQAQAIAMDGIKISFQRSSGAERVDGGFTEVSTISFSGGGAEYKVNIEPATGSHSVERGGAP